jgi:hypothetical protein
MARPRRYLKGAWFGELKDQPEDLQLVFRRCNEVVFDTDFMWCKRCEHAYPVGCLHVVGGPDAGNHEWNGVSMRCPVLTCDGANHDFRPWNPLFSPRREHPEYPETPEPFGLYPLAVKPPAE